MLHANAAGCCRAVANAIREMSVFTSFFTRRESIVDLTSFTRNVTLERRAESLRVRKLFKREPRLSLARYLGTRYNALATISRNLVFDDRAVQAKAAAMPLSRHSRRISPLFFCISTCCSLKGFS